MVISKFMFQSTQRWERSTKKKNSEMGNLALTGQEKCDQSFLSLILYFDELCQISFVM